MKKARAIDIPDSKHLIWVELVSPDVHGIGTIFITIDYPRVTIYISGRQASGDEFLTMSLLRDRIPGVGHRYIQFPLENLVAELQKYSPLSLAAPPVADCQASSGSDGEENALPAVIETKQPRAATPPEADIVPGGGGGESNSPAKCNLPGLIVSLLDQLATLGETAAEIKKTLKEGTLRET